METRPIVLYNSWPDSVGSSPCKCSVCWAKFQAAQFFPHVCVCVCVCVHECCVPPFAHPGKIR